MANKVVEGGFAISFEEAAIRHGLHHATMASECFELVVGEVAVVVTKRTRSGVGAHHRLFTFFEHIVESALAAVR